ncbi:MAG: hypothetical protein L0Y54_21535 [Sporichthyaceae bacterium]|nr:hypothetical protein [Sporichthyaceae bacterium]
MAAGIQVVIDCADPAKLARFWAEALGYVVQPPPPGYQSWEDFLREQGVPKDRWNMASAVVDPDGKGPRVFLQQVPEGKVVKNRVHIDVVVTAGLSGDEALARLEAESERLQSLGAERLDLLSELGSTWIVHRDPEGNEFCVH